MLINFKCTYFYRSVNELHYTEHFYTFNTTQEPGVYKKPGEKENKSHTHFSFNSNHSLSLNQTRLYTSTNKQLLKNHVRSSASDCLKKKQKQKTVKAKTKAAVEGDAVRYANESY